MRNRQLSFQLLVRERKIIPEENKIISEKLYNKLETEIKEDSKIGYVQGQDVCPICKGVVNYTYSRFEGFTLYECSSNDCLPWPNGGAKKRREDGLSKISILNRR